MMEKASLFSVLHYKKAEFLSVGVYLAHRYGHGGSEAADASICQSHFVPRRVADGAAGVEAANEFITICVN